MVRFTAETNAGKTFGHTPTAQQRKNDDTAAQARTQKRQPDAVHPALVALRAGRLGVTFSGAGFGAAYQLGAAEMLTNLGVLCAQTPVAGRFGPSCKGAAQVIWYSYTYVEKIICYVYISITPAEAS